MTLLIDAGNTRIKFGLARPGGGRHEHRWLALAHADLERLPDWLATLPAAPTRALGVNVAGPTIATRLDHLVQALCGASVQWVRSTRSAAGVLNLYEDPNQLGTDRWISMIGLATHTSAAAVLASFGTATTIDTLGPASGAATHIEPSQTHPSTHEVPARRFEGGVILPGPELMRRSLASGTADLPYADGVSAPFPRNTHAAISSGIAAAQAGAVLRQWRLAIDILDEAPRLYCTGGGWQLVRDEITTGLARLQADLGLDSAPPQWLDAPVLDGLAALAD